MSPYRLRKTRLPCIEHQPDNNKQSTQTGRQTDRQADGRAGRQAGKQAGRQADRIPIPGHQADRAYTDTRSPGRQGVYRVYDWIYCVPNKMAYIKYQRSRDAPVDCVPRSYLQALYHWVQCLKEVNQDHATKRCRYSA